MMPNRHAALPVPTLPERQDQIDFLAPGPSEIPGSLWGTNIFPGPAFLFGVAVGLLSSSALIWVVVP